MTFSDLQLPSNRKFGLFFFFFFFLLALISFMEGKGNLTVTFGLVSFMFLILAVFFPKLLLPFNIAWMFFGVILGRIFNPIILAIIYFILITPIAYISRAFGRDELRLKKVKTNSYWIKIKKEVSNSTHFKNQF